MSAPTRQNLVVLCLALIGVLAAGASWAQGRRAPRRLPTDVRARVLPDRPVATGEKGFQVARAETSLPRPGTKCPPPPPRHKIVFDIEALREQVSARSGTHRFEAQIGIAIFAPQDHWQAWLGATPLESEDDEDLSIEPASLSARKLEGPWSPLDGRCELEDDGERGTAYFTVELAVEFEEPQTPGTYEGRLVVFFVQHAHAPIKRMCLPLFIEVGGETHHEISDHKVYFHYGRVDQAEPMEAEIAGTLDSDIPLVLRLSAGHGRADELVQMRSFPARDNDDLSATIPVAWTLAEQSSLSPRGADRVVDDGRGLIWEVDGLPGRIEYRLRCRPAPAADQAPGDYGQSLCVELVPRL